MTRAREFDPAAMPAPTTMPVAHAAHSATCARAADPSAACTCHPARADSEARVQLAGDNFGIVRPADPGEARHFSRTGRVCGTCSKFDQSEAAKTKIRGEKFYQRLVREEGWKLRHLGSDPATHGLCGESNGEVLTGAFHDASKCPAYRENRGLVKLSR